MSKSDTAFRDFVVSCLNETITDEEAEYFCLDPETTHAKAILLAQIAKAYAGDTRAAEFVIELANDEGLLREDDCEDPLSKALREMATVLQNDHETYR